MEGFISALVLLIIASWVNLLSKKLKFPYTILLFVVWIALIPVVKFFEIWDVISLTPELLFYVFLPILVFESAYSIKYKQLAKSWVTIWSLATVWLLLSAVVIAFGLHYILVFFGVNIPIPITFLFGAIISATDPVAVLALFKNLWVSKRLSLIFEWESLFNDWTAIALFLVVIEILRSWVFNWNSIFVWGLQFIIMILWWIVFGTFMAIIFAKSIKFIKNNEPVEITLTMLLAHITFILAEYISHHVMIGGFELKISWIIATAYAAVVMWNYWKTKISPRVEEYMERFWWFFAFLCNSLIFLLMWLVVSKITIPLKDVWLPVIVAIFITIVARILSVYVPLFFSNIFVEKKIPPSWKKLLAWWDLRWVVALTLALMIPNDLSILGRNFAYSIKEFILLLVISTIIFSLLVKGLTMKKLIVFFGLDKFYTLEKFERHETEILIYNKIVDKIHRMKLNYHTSKENYDWLIQKYSSKLEESLLKMKVFLESQKDPVKIIFKALSLHALWVEKDYLQQMFKYNEIDEYFYLHWLEKIEKQSLRIEAWEKQIQPGQKQKFTLSVLDIFLKKYAKEKMSDHDLYILYRTKFIVASKVIKSLEDLKSVDFGYDKKIFDNVISLYKDFHISANQEISKLKDKNPSLINNMNHKLLNKWLMKTEENIIKDLYSKDMVTEKLYKHFLHDIEKEVLEKY